MQQFVHHACIAIGSLGAPIVAHCVELFVFPEGHPGRGTASYKGKEELELWQLLSCKLSSAAPTVYDQQLCPLSWQSTSTD
jgi:hypothetical protein|mmetsp:Transcript_51861/g.85307  ORF Transcript_51861/g.85307 Transcript_51861/m.85307 type:complete len:81 (+) Transcript_51861:402-644(+)